MSAANKCCQDRRFFLETRVDETWTGKMIALVGTNLANRMTEANVILQSAGMENQPVGVRRDVLG